MLGSHVTCVLHTARISNVENGEEKEKERQTSLKDRENRAGAKDRGRPFTSIFSQDKSYLKRLTTVIFAEVDVHFWSRYQYSMNLGLREPLSKPEILVNFERPEKTLRTTAKSSHTFSIIFILLSVDN